MIEVKPAFDGAFSVENLFKEVQNREIHSAKRYLRKKIKERENQKFKKKKFKKKKFKKMNKENKSGLKDKKENEDKKIFFGINKVLNKEKRIDVKMTKEFEENREEELKKALKKEKIIDKKISRKFTEAKKEEIEEVMEKEKRIDVKMTKEFEEETKEKDEKIEKFKKKISESRKLLDELREEVAKVVVGYEDVIDGIIRGFLCNGHVMVEGVPGTAKTLLIKTMAAASGCTFSRIQFTVDLLPTDITGMTTYDESRRAFSTIKGPIFANFVIADEINRAPPKTQSAMLEAMQEKQVTIGKESYKLKEPFFVMANKNPLESSGTYNLPEAQIDRFLFKLIMGYTTNENEEKVIEQNITIHEFKEFGIKSIVSPSEIIKMQELTKKIVASPKIKKYIVQLVDATRNPSKYGIRSGKYIEWGCSPRASIGLAIAAKADAFMKDSVYVTPQNVKNIIYDVFRHRIILNYLGQAEKINPDEIVTEILNKVPLP